MVQKRIDQLLGSEFGESKVSLVDGLAYALRSEIEAGGSAAPLLEELLSSLRADELRIPILPETVCRVMSLINEPDVNVGELAMLVELDPGLALKIVGVANSSFYGGIEPAISIRSALMRMGLLQARNIVVAVALRSSLFKVPGFESEAQAVWLHSLFTAFATQALLADSPPWQDTGFLLDLTHDIGRISILSFAEECRS